MAAQPRNQRVEWQSLLFTTGLKDVVAEVYVNGVAKAVGSNAIALTEVDATNSPGLYELNLTSALLTSWGVVAGGENSVSGYILSKAAKGYAPFKLTANVYVADDVMAALGTFSTGTAGGDIADAKATLQAQIQTLNNGLNLLTGASANPNSSLLAIGGTIPATGSNTIRIPIRIRNLDGVPITPTAISVTLTSASAGGADRGMNLQGSTQPSGGGAYTLTPVAASQGLYYVNVNIPAGSVPEAQTLMVSFTYTDNGTTINDVIFGVINVTTDILAAGLATAVALAAAQTTVTSVLAKLNDSVVGLANIEAQVVQNGQQAAANASAIAGVQNSVNTANLGIASANTAIGNVQSALTAAQGSNFTAGADDLHSISQYLRTVLAPGGRAV